MSKPLAVSASFSVFMMAAFVLLATPSADQSGGIQRSANETGAMINVTAPATIWQPELPSLIN